MATGPSCPSCPSDGAGVLFQQIEPKLPLFPQFPPGLATRWHGRWGRALPGLGWFFPALWASRGLKNPKYTETAARTNPSSALPPVLCAVPPPPAAPGPGRGVLGWVSMGGSQGGLGVSGGSGGYHGRPGGCSRASWWVTAPGPPAGLQFILTWGILVLSGRVSAECPRLGGCRRDWGHGAALPWPRRAGAAAAEGNNRCKSPRKGPGARPMVPARCRGSGRVGGASTVPVTRMGPRAHGPEGHRQPPGRALQLALPSQPPVPQAHPGAGSAENGARDAWNSRSHGRDPPRSCGAGWDRGPCHRVLRRGRCSSGKGRDPSPRVPAPAGPAPPGRGVTSDFPL